MKTITIFKTAILVVIFSFFSQFAVKAQNLSIFTSVGQSLDQRGPVRNLSDPGFGIMALAGIGKKNVVSGGINLDGGYRYGYWGTVRTMDLKRDSSAWLTTNAPAIQFAFAINLPEGDDSNPFAGPIFGLAYGAGFPDMNRLPVGDFKLFLQGNYGGDVIGGFANVSFNYLGTSVPLYNWQVSIGVHLKFKNAFGSAEQ